MFLNTLKWFGGLTETKINEYSPERDYQEVLLIINLMNYTFCLCIYIVNGLRLKTYYKLSVGLQCIILCSNNYNILFKKIKISKIRSHTKKYCSRMF